MEDVDINEYYSDIDDLKYIVRYSGYSDDEKRKIIAAGDYFKTIGEEVLCQVGEFYKTNGRYPNEDEIESFQEQAVNEEVKSGVYDIKLEVGKKPNEKDFTILFDKSCNNETIKEGNVVILSPLYEYPGRYCVHNNIDDIVNNLGKIRDGDS